jgi:UDP-glucose-4-epimerase GalE
LPIREKTPQSPINPYGASKAMVERLLSDFGVAHALKAIVLRFNAAGADPENEIGESHDPETHLVPLLLDAASGHRKSVTVFGTDYPTHDGTCVRDYIHVSDLAEAHIKALRALLDGGQSSIYNLGNGRGYSVKEVIAAVERVTGLTVPVVFGDRRPGDPAALISDASKARDDLNWQPQFAQIDEIVRTAWAWRQEDSARSLGCKRATS